MARGRLVIISGPSAGVGKDTVIKMFLERHKDWTMPPSTTTRLPRNGDVDGKDMNFVSTEQFEKLKNETKFLETDFHADNWYGTLREPVEKLLTKGHNVILRVDVNGALNIKQNLPDTLTIFITAENFEALEARIRERQTESEDEIERRLILAKKELNYKNKFDKIIINKTDKQSETLRELEDLLLG